MPFLSLKGQEAEERKTTQNLPHPPQSTSPLHRTALKLLRHAECYKFPPRAGGIAVGIME